MQARILLIAALATCIAAWGPLGHSIVATLANERLSASGKGYLQKVFEGTKSTNLSSIANSPDLYIRYGGDWSRECHYVNLPRSATNYTTSHCGSCCVVSAIANYTKLVQSDKVNPKQCYWRGEPCALSFLTHYLGDIHQPLHISYEDDRGGNDVHVCWDGKCDKQQNLHKVWDSKIIKMWNNDITNATAELNMMISDSKNSMRIKELLKVDDPADWANESFEIVRRDCYKFQNENLDIPDHLYYRNNLPIVQWRLIAGGLRLAKLLNRILA